MSPREPVRRIFAILALVCAATAAHGADWREHGPRALIVTYHVAPADRIAFTAAVRTRMLPRLERLRATGALDSYHLLANRYVDSATWDLMLILDFHTSAMLARWRQVEAQAPAGLEPSALRLVTSIESAPADPMFGSAAPRHPGDPATVYLLVPYQYFVSEDEYLAYAKSYLVPQTEGWLAAGVLQSYRLYLPRYPAGRDWSALLVLGYRGDAGLARRDAVVKAVRAHLAATSPQWNAFAQRKQKLRTEKQATIAEELLP